MSKLRLLIAATLLISQRAAWTCGGSYTFSPSLYPAAASLVIDSFEGTAIAPFRFLDPFRLAGLYEGERLARIAYELPDDDAAPAPAPPIPALDDFHAAIAAGDRTGAARSAAQIVARVLSLAAPLAQAHAADLRRAVEYLEVEPELSPSDDSRLAAIFGDASLPPAEVARSGLLQGLLAVREAPFKQAAETLARFPDSPRRPSLELAVLRNRITSEIGNGWPGQIQGTPDATWDGLIGDHDAWIARYPSHPLVDLARLQKLRLLYLHGDSEAAWDLLLDLYGRRPGRALWEMRHLVLNGFGPPRTVLDSVQDPVLAAALVYSVIGPSPTQWTRLWHSSEPAAGKGAAWAINLQERLLFQLASADSPDLPKDFPSEPAKPSELWGQLRALVLEHTGKTQEALRQAGLLDTAANTDSASIAATALVEAGDIRGAVALPALDRDTAVYLLQIKADDRTLADMTAHGSVLAADTLALRRLGAKGRWGEGAEVLAAAAPERAASWREAAERSQGRAPAQRLALARWLLEHEGALFPQRSSETWRGVKRLLDTPLSGVERDRLVGWLLRGGEREWALQAYSLALKDLKPESEEARGALREADALYNRLLNWDYALSESYERLLASSPAAERIRLAGKRIRAAHQS
jgi:hypothetical protein